MDWFRTKSQSQPKEMESLASPKDQLKKEIGEFLKTMNLEEVPNLSQLIKKSDFIEASLLKEVFQKTVQLTYFKQFVKSLTENQEKKTVKQLKQQLGQKNSGQVQSFEKLQRLIDSQNDELQLFKVVQKNINKMYQNIEKNQIDLSKKVQTISIRLDKYQNIYQKVTKIRPQLKKIVMQQIELEKGISVIIANEQDEVEEFERLFNVLNQRNERHQAICENLKKQESQLEKRRQKIQILELEAENYKKYILKQQELIQRNILRFKQKIQRGFCEPNVNHSDVIDIKEKDLEIKNSIEIQNILKIEGIQNMNQSINRLYQLLESSFGRAEQLTQKLQNINEKMLEIQRMENQKQKYNLKVGNELREQTEKEDSQFKFNQKLLRETENQKLKFEPKQLGENEHMKAKEEFPKKRDLDNQQYAKKLQQQTHDEEKKRQLELQAQMIKNITQKIQTFEKGERERLQIQRREWKNAKQSELQQVLRKQSDQIIKKVQEKRKQEQQKLKKQIDAKKDEWLKALENQISQRKKSEQSQLKQKKYKIQQEIIKYNQEQYQIELKKLAKQIKIEEEKLKVQLKQMRQKEIEKINEDIKDIKKRQQTNLKIQKQKYITSLQRQKQQYQKRIHEQLKSYQSKEDLRIQEQLRITRQIKDLQQKKMLQQNRNEQDTKIRKNLEQERKLEDKIQRQKIKISRQALNHDCSKFFAHNILRKRLQYKQFLINTISEKYCVDIEDTELLFTFDPKNKTNFHQYIDNKCFLLVLIELQNGRILAAYTQQAFKPKVKGTGAFIACLNTKEVYYFKHTDKSSISYDEYYIIFGNSEIRLKSGEKLLFSNFGIGNSIFDHKGHNLDQLLGNGKNSQVPLISYEIYQLKFE